MYDNITTRKDGYAFGLERSGYIVATKAKERYFQLNKAGSPSNQNFDLSMPNNPLLYKQPRHG